MRRLILIRHSKAARSQPGEQDIARPLIERGRGDAARLGAYMAAHRLIPDHVLLSPAQRAQETWKQASAALPSAARAMISERLYNATAHSLLAAIKDAPASAQAVLVVGHNPGLHELALMLIASGDIEMREALGEELPTSGLVVIEFPITDWRALHQHSGRLERFVTPRSLDAGDA